VGQIGLLDCLGEVIEEGTRLARKVGCPLIFSRPQGFPCLVDESLRRQECLPFLLIHSPRFQLTEQGLGLVDLPPSLLHKAPLLIR